MSEALRRIEELEKQRAQLNADIDREVEGLKAKALQDLESMRAQMAAFESVLKVPVAPQVQRAAPQRERTPLDDTDAGNGIREAREDYDSAQDFRDELAELRERTAAKRRKIA